MQFHRQTENFTESFEASASRDASTGLLTTRQFETLETIRKFVERFHMSPSLREIANEMNIRTINGVRAHLVALERKGYLHPRSNRSRSIVLKSEEPEEAPGIPILANVVCCRLSSDLSDKYLDLDSARFYARKNYLGVVFCDDSLLKEYSIRRGDCLLIRKTRDISNGELVLATDRSREVFVVKFCGNSADGTPIFRSYGKENRKISIVDPKIHGIVEMQLRFPNPRATLLDEGENLRKRIEEARQEDQTEQIDKTEKEDKAGRIDKTGKEGKAEQIGGKREEARRVPRRVDRGDGQERQEK